MLNGKSQLIDIMEICLEVIGHPAMDLARQMIWLLVSQSRKKPLASFHGYTFLWA